MSRRPGRGRDEIRKTFMLKPESFTCMNPKVRFG